VLITRVVTAAVLLPLAVGGIMYLPTAAVTAIFAVLMTIGAWEWSRLLGWRRPLARSGYTLIFIIIALVLARRNPGVVNMASTGGGLQLLACFWWLVAVYWLFRFPRGWGASIGRPLIGAGIGLLVLGAALSAVAAIHAHGRGAWLLLFFFMLIWGADSGAYFCGRGFGRHKLAPRISPGKTREGAAGGVATTLIVAAIGGSLLGYKGGQWVGFIVLGGWIAGISMVGDLTLSMFKRYAEVKDSGTLFPGHGGLLDRLDSTLAAAPWFALGLLWLG